MGRHERTARALASVRRRGITLTGLAMIVAGLIWAAIAWADEAEFKVQKASGKYVTVKVDDEDTSTYKTYRLDGENRQGRSLPSVLKAAEIENDEWTSVTVDGLTVRKGEFPNKKPPIFIVKGDDDLTFYRPKSASGPADTRSGIAVMTMRAPIDIEASDNSPKAGQTVTYKASVRGGGDGDFEFAWSASSGEEGEGATFEYTYPKTTQEVTISVTARRENGAGTVGSSTTSPVEIEAPPPSNNTGSGGYTPPSSGYSPGYSTPSDSYDDYDYNFPDTGSTPDEFPETKIPKVPKTEETPPLEDFGTSVEGELLSAVAPLPPASGDDSAAPPADDEAADPEEAIEEAEKISAPGALIAGGIVIGLLGLGAGREMENVRPRRLPRPDLSGLRRLSPPWK